MKQQIYQKILDTMVDKRSDHSALQNLIAKYEIIKSGGDRSASVIKELMNS